LFPVSIGNTPSGSLPETAFQKCYLVFNRKWSQDLVGGAAEKGEGSNTGRKQENKALMPVHPLPFGSVDSEF
jgi:hypothetical protein